MTKLFLVAALAGALIGAAGMGLAQQQPAPGAVPELATCSQMAAFCNRGCESVHGPAHGSKCLPYCRQTLTDCLASGYWRNPNTGQLVRKRKE